MKCPKCLYIGFETGDRCKNCGYDFSLLAAAEAAAGPPDLAIRMALPGDVLPDDGEPDVSAAISDAWTGPVVDRFRDLPEPNEPAMTLAGPRFTAEPEPLFEPDLASPPELPRASRVAAVSMAAAAAADTPALPLFAPDDLDDEPLVKLPAVPRVPLSVRRTPEVPRLRHVAPDPPRFHEDAVLEFSEEPDETFELGELPDEPRPRIEPPEPVRARAAAGDAGALSARLMAALIDYGILLGIDATVLYFTLRLTELDLADWRMLPMLPMAAFLLSLKVAYFSAFTTAGGQTIGKMATHIRVVSDDGHRLDAGRALRRALLGLASVVTVGAPFLPALKDPAHRGVHDRASGTRVVALSHR